MDKIIVFQQAGSGEVKIRGIRQYGSGLIISKVFDLPSHLPDFIDTPEEYFREDFTGDLVLSFLKHPDLLDHIAVLCREKKIPLIASGGKNEAAITPFTCCSLGRLPGLGLYGEQFGIPEYEVDVRENKICGMEVKRGASCGASWELSPGFSAYHLRRPWSPLPGRRNISAPPIRAILIRLPAKALCTWPARFMNRLSGWHWPG
jgi:hypothetical protein